VIQDTMIYLTDNGRALCGAHLGVTARATGRDISGQEILPVTPEMVAEFGAVRCEHCGRPASSRPRSRGLVEATIEARKRTGLTSFHGTGMLGTSAKAGQIFVNITRAVGMKDRTEVEQVAGPFSLTDAIAFLDAFEG
jgi:hypothetical protein